MPEVISAVLIAVVGAVSMLLLLLTQRQWADGWNTAASQLGMVRHQHVLTGIYRGRNLMITIQPDQGAFGSTHIQLHLKLPYPCRFELRHPYKGRRTLTAEPAHLVEQIFMDAPLWQQLMNHAEGLYCLRLTAHCLEYGYERIHPERVKDACNLLCEIADALEGFRGEHDTI